MQNPTGSCSLSGLGCAADVVGTIVGAASLLVTDPTGRRSAWTAEKKTLEKRFFSEHQIILLCCHSVNRYLREESRVCEMTASDMSKRTTEQSASVEYNTQRPRNTALYVRPNGICFVEKASNKLPICKVAELSWMQWVCRIICSKAEYNRRFYCKT